MLETPRNLVGVFVILEQSNPDVNHSTYNNGEYLILQQTPNTLYGVKPMVGYEGTLLKPFTLHGQHAYTVFNPCVNVEMLRRFAEGMEAFSIPPAKPSWNSSVYEAAARVADLARNALKKIETHEEGSGQESNEEPEKDFGAVRIQIDQERRVLKVKNTSRATVFLSYDPYHLLAREVARSKPE